MPTVPRRMGIIIPIERYNAIKAFPRKSYSDNANAAMAPMNKVKANATNVTIALLRKYVGNAALSVTVSYPIKLKVSALGNVNGAPKIPLRVLKELSTIMTTGKSAMMAYIVRIISGTKCLMEPNNLEEGWFFIVILTTHTSGHAVPR